MSNLDQQAVERLKAPFPPGDHDFRKGGSGRTLTYLREDAVTGRLDEVDPNWSYEIVSITLREHIIQAGEKENRHPETTNDKLVEVHVRMTVRGVQRESVGMALMSDASGEGIKSAETDALKRVARRFGIGQYLVRTPNWVRDETSIAKWLNGSNTSNQPQTSAHQQQGNSDEPRALTHWRTLVKNEYASDQQHANKQIYWMVNMGYLDPDAKADDVLNAATRVKKDKDEGKLA